jgi:hypothetical protein
MPAVKAQLGPLPGGIVFSAIAGLGFPTGASRISGPGYNPYVQFSWSREIGGGWSLGGIFWFAGQTSNAISEVMFVVEREVGVHGDLLSSMLAIARTTASRANSSIPTPRSGFPALANQFSRGLRTNQQIAELSLWLGLLDPVRWHILTGSAQKKRRPLGRLRAVSVISDRRHHVRSRRPPPG